MPIYGCSLEKAVGPSNMHKSGAVNTEKKIKNTIQYQDKNVGMSMSLVPYPLREGIVFKDRTNYHPNEPLNSGIARNAKESIKPKINRVASTSASRLNTRPTLIPQLKDAGKISPISKMPKEYATFYLLDQPRKQPDSRMGNRSSLIPQLKDSRDRRCAKASASPPNLVLKHKDVDKKRFSQASNFKTATEYPKGFLLQQPLKRANASTSASFVGDNSPSATHFKGLGKKEFFKTFIKNDRNESPKSDASELARRIGNRPSRIPRYIGVGKVAFPQNLTFKQQITNIKMQINVPVNSVREFGVASPTKTDDERDLNYEISATSRLAQQFNGSLNRDKNGGALLCSNSMDNLSLTKTTPLDSITQIPYTPHFNNRDNLVQNERRFFAAVILQSWRRQHTVLQDLTKQLDFERRQCNKSKNQLDHVKSLISTEMKYLSVLATKFENLANSIDSNKNLLYELEKTWIFLKLDRYILKQKLELKNVIIDHVQFSNAQLREQIDKRVILKRELEEKIQQKQTNIAKLEKTKGILSRLVEGIRADNVKAIDKLRHESEVRMAPLRREQMEMSAEVERKQEELQTLALELNTMEQNLRLKVKESADEVEKLQMQLSQTLEFRIWLFLKKTGSLDIALNILHWMSYLMLPTVPKPNETLLEKAFSKLIGNYEKENSNN